MPSVTRFTTKTRPNGLGLVGRVPRPGADISPDYQWHEHDDRIGKRIIELDKSPEAIRYFAKNCKPLSSYAYWFFLSTLWVSYTGFSDLKLWRELFSSTRKNRETSIMKPSELRAYRALPDVVDVLRAHRPGETDWIAYTTDPQVAARFAKERGISEVTLYEVDKADILAYFLRRGESEIIVLDKSRARFVKVIPVEFEEEAEKKQAADEAVYDAALLAFAKRQVRKAEDWIAQNNPANHPNSHPNTLSNRSGEPKGRNHVAN